MESLNTQTINPNAPHPLHNHVVLEQVFEYIQSTSTFRDWKNIRLVCKLWHEEFLTTWRNNAVLCLARDTCILEPPLQKKISVSDYLTELKNPNSPYRLLEKPYLKYKFENMTIDLPHCKEKTEGNVFWTSIGPNIGHLTLKNVKITTATNSSLSVLRFLVRTMPNLTTLTMIDVSIDGKKGGRLPSKTVELHPNVISLNCEYFRGFRFSMFPNLQQANLTGFISWDLVNFIASSGSVGRQLGSLTNASIKHLDLMNSSIGYSPSLREQLSNIKLTALERASINLHSDNETHQPENGLDFVPVFLQNHNNTLKVLELFSWIGNLPPEISPISIHLPVLTELRLWGNIVSNLSFLRFTPNLQLLHMDLYGFEKQEKMCRKVYDSLGQRAFLQKADMIEAARIGGSLRGMVMEKLKYLQINYRFSSESVRILSEWMPNLKVLKLVLDSNNMPVVCEKMPKLEELHCLFGSGFGNQNVTGEFGKSGERQMYGLVDLKCLKSFHYNTECNRSTFTDRSVHHGFLKMSELIDLRICVSNEFTEEAEQKLRNSIQNVKVYRNHVFNENHANWKCCRNKDYKRFLLDHEWDVDRAEPLFSDSELDE